MQSQTFSFPRASALLALLLTTFVSTLLLGGCGSSVYHKVGAALPGDPADRLALRIREARNAADAAMAEIDKPGDITPARAARADDLAWEYSRRVASVQDIMRRLTTPDLEAQQVLASLEKAEEELTAAVSKLSAAAASPADPTAIITPASTALAAAIESSDQFVNGRANAAMLPDKSSRRRD